VVTPFRIEREWNRFKGRFRNVRGEEAAYASALLAAERQAARAMLRDPSLRADGVAAAYRWAGIQTAAALDGQTRVRFEGFTEAVADLAYRCRAACDPECNPEMAACLQQYPFTAAARSGHLTRWGSLWRRLIDSAAFWGPRGPRAYLEFIRPTLERVGFDPAEDRLYWILFTGSQVRTETGLGGHPPAQ